MNRRILYNRASVNRQGRAVQPAQVGRPLERGEEGVGRRRSRRRHAAGRDESLHHAGLGVGQLYLAGPRGRAVPRALRAGGEPGAESALEDPVESRARRSGSPPSSTEYGTPDVFPIVGTTYRVSEHWQTGAMSRNMPWLVGPRAARVRRDRHRSGPARRDQERRPGDREQRAGLHRGLRAGHRALPAVLRRRPDGRRDRPALALGLCGHRAGRHRQRPHRERRRRELADSRDQGVSLQHQEKGPRHDDAGP